jgi:endonuclease/exonuclease/phosphatase family metal-dependent hydrolase
MPNTLLLLFGTLLATALPLLAQLSAFMPATSQTGHDALARTQLRVLSYNIHHASPPSKSGQIDIEAIAKVIRAAKPDLVALQEVDVNTNRSNGIDQAKQLCLKSGMKHSYFAKAIDHDGGEYGVAILSNFVMTATHSFPLPDDPSKPSEPRILAIATVQIPGSGELHFATTHLDHTDEANRLLQMQQIRQMANLHQTPMLLAGDFNAQPISETIKILDSTFKRTCNPCDPTFPQLKPDRTIDYIAFKPESRFKVISHQVIAETYASDHRPILSVLEFR